MDNYEQLAKGYSSKKLLEIVEKQISSYNEDFIDYVKDELIKRGDKFQYDADYVKIISEMNDDELKIIVEKDWNNYHLEYVEIARIEYIKREFKNDTSNDTSCDGQIENKVVRYPTLQSIVDILNVVSYIIGFIAAGVSVFLYLNSDSQSGLIFAVPTLVIGTLIVLGLIALSESIKVIIDIEENTRSFKN
jgi:hypothetical protein